MTKTGMASMTIETALALGALIATITASSSFFLCGVHIEISGRRLRIRIEPRRK